MNENIDLTKVLEGCPKGTKFYSTVFGEVSLEKIDTSDEYPIKLLAYNKFVAPSNFYCTKDGRWFSVYDGECVLFPSKDQRDWSKFERFWDKPKVEKFDPNTLQPFDKVLVRDYNHNEWTINFFASIADLGCKIIKCANRCWLMCIPYNDETKHLLDTKDECPEYYKWWEVL